MLVKWPVSVRWSGEHRDEILGFTHSSVPALHFHSTLVRPGQRVAPVRTEVPHPWRLSGNALNATTGGGNVPSCRGWGVGRACANHDQRSGRMPFTSSGAAETRGDRQGDSLPGLSLGLVRPASPPRNRPASASGMAALSPGCLGVMPAAARQRGTPFRVSLFLSCNRAG